MKKLFCFLTIITVSVCALNAQKKNLPVRANLDKVRNNAYRAYNEAKFDSALIYFNSTIDFQEAKYGHFSDITARSYANLGIVYKKLFQFRKALELFNISETIYREIDPESISLSFIYNNKANIYFSYSDFAEAELYYKNSLDHLIKIDSINDLNFGTITLNLFNVIIAQNRINEARDLISVIKNLNTSGIGTYTKHLFLAQAYLAFGDIDLSLHEYNLAEQTLDNLELTSPTYRIELNYKLASILILKKDLNLALSLLLNNLEYFHNLPTLDYLSLAETYLLIGEIYYQKDDYKNAYTWLADANAELQTSLIEANLDADSSAIKILGNVFVDLKNALAKISSIQYEKTNDLKYLFQALDIYTEIIDLLNVHRLHMKNENSKLSNTESRIELMQDAINLAIRTYEITGENKYLELAFHYSENTKAFVLLSEIKKVEAMQFADLPANVLEKEERLSNEITAYEEMIFEEKTSEHPDSTLLSTLNTTLFHLNDNYNNLHDSIEYNYPRYYALKYKTDFSTLNEVQQNLGRKECLVEFVLTDTILSTFIIDKEQIKVLTQPVNDDFDQECFTYFSLLQNQDFSSEVHKTYREYLRLGKKFYDVLVAPVLEITESRDITFVPDGAITYLPFETFITKDVDKEYINYHDLPYLIYDLSIGYSYSSTMLYSPRIRTRHPEKKALAFAPSYENLMGNDEHLVWNRQANPDMLMPLPGARMEVTNISKTVPSDVFFDEDASEENFKKLASGYSMLHLAMHTIMNDEDPMFSKLAFTRNFNDSTEDNDLFTYEIYNLKLNADLIVLSSCSSGFGKMQKGEGMMSMARGFIYAGCPSIIMTLWQVSDKSSSVLMSGFYKHLRKGLNKQKSLRKAKINYIKSSDNLKSNPYFWSAFLIVGDNSPLFGPGASFYFFLILTSFILIVLHATYKRQIKQFIQKKKKTK